MAKTKACDQDTMTKKEKQQRADNLRIQLGVAIKRVLLYQQPGTLGPTVSTVSLPKHEYGLISSHTIVRDVPASFATRTIAEASNSVIYDA